MTKSTPVPIDGRDVILRDKYRAIVAEYSSEVVEILSSVQPLLATGCVPMHRCIWRKNGMVQI